MGMIRLGQPTCMEGLRKVSSCSFFKYHRAVAPILGTARTCYSCPASFPVLLGFTTPASQIPPGIFSAVLSTSPKSGSWTKSFLMSPHWPFLSCLSIF